VRQQISYLINALGSDDSLDTEPEHGYNNETDDAGVAEPESKRRASENREWHAEPCANGASQHYDNSNGEMPERNTVASSASCPQAID
jgi:hypothetical protein